MRKDGGRIRITAQLIEAGSDRHLWSENFDANEMYFIARELFIKRDQLPESIRLFQKAVELDPNFARAWAGLAAVDAVLEAYVFGDDFECGRP